jgi:orotidine-5'-phosphate decarboxylase
MNNGIRFGERYSILRRRKDSVLCVGLDPALPAQRRTHVISATYLDAAESSDARFQFCLDRIDAIADAAIAVKPNQQYLFGFTAAQHRTLTASAHAHDLLAILDYKLNDIGSTAQSALYHLIQAGYDALTVNPLPGNLPALIAYAHAAARQMRGYELGLIVVTLMSNPEAEYMLKTAEVDGVPLYAAIAQQVARTNADGCVVGASDYVTADDVATVRRIVGPKTVFLIPGVGAQGGDVAPIRDAAGDNVLINVGCAIIYADDPRVAAHTFAERLNHPE